MFNPIEKLNSMTSVLSAGSTHLGCWAYCDYNPLVPIPNGCEVITNEFADLKAATTRSLKLFHDLRFVSSFVARKAVDKSRETHTHTPTNLGI